MDLGFKYAEHKEKEARFSELADDIRELVEANMNWKNNPKPFLRKVMEKINEKSESLLTFGESEKKFAIFLEDAVKQAAKAPTAKNPATVKILDRNVDNVMDMEKEILTDMGTIAQVITLANRQNIQGLSKLIEKPDSQIMVDLTISQGEWEKIVRADFRRKVLD
ncbi:hypothetical protein H0N99_05100 [Candidatus Micrarchaeota archaeon]|nr:hypothetical protein [Candidatus Micrarchaeota archaeon]